MRICVWHKEQCKKKKAFRLLASATSLLGVDCVINLYETQLQS